MAKAEAQAHPALRAEVPVIESIRGLAPEVVHALNRALLDAGELTDPDLYALVLACISPDKEQIEAAKALVERLTQQMFEPPKLGPVPNIHDGEFSAAQKLPGARRAKQALLDAQMSAPKDATRIIAELKQLGLLESTRRGVWATVAGFPCRWQHVA